MWRTGEPAVTQRILADAVAIVSPAASSSSSAHHLVHTASTRTRGLPKPRSCRPPDRLAGPAQYDPVLGHETHGRKSFEDMIRTFSQVTACVVPLRICAPVRCSHHSSVMQVSTALRLRCHQQPMPAGVDDRAA
jgi:hypothetical protein